MLCWSTTRLNRSHWRSNRRKDVTRLSVSAPSSFSKPFASLLVASLDAVAIAIAETNIELSPEHAMFRGLEVAAKSVAPVLSNPEALVQAVAEIILGLRVAGRCRDSEPLHRHALRSRNSQTVSIPQGKVVLRDIMVGHGRLVIPEHGSR